MLTKIFKRPLPTRHTLGDRGERLAGGYLRRRFYRILERNYRCRPGEIDIIAGKGDLLVVVEVKTRQKPFLNHPLYSIGPEKMDRIIRATRYYTHQKRVHDYYVRFDVITVIFSQERRFPRITHLKNAFNTAYMPTWFTSWRIRKQFIRGFFKGRR